MAFLRIQVVEVEVVVVVEVVLLNKDFLLVCFLDPSDVGSLRVVLRHEVLHRVLQVALQEVRHLGVLQMVQVLHRVLQGCLLHYQIVRYHSQSCHPDDVRLKCLKCLLVHRYRGSDWRSWLGEALYFLDGSGLLKVHLGQSLGSRRWKTLSYLGYCQWAYRNFLVLCFHRKVLRVYQDLLQGWSLDHRSFPRSRLQ
jgi:hypothetical protein